MVDLEMLVYNIDAAEDVWIGFGYEVGRLVKNHTGCLMVTPETREERKTDFSQKPFYFPNLVFNR